MQQKHPILPIPLAVVYRAEGDKAGKYPVKSQCIKGLLHKKTEMTHVSTNHPLLMRTIANGSEEPT